MREYETFYILRADTADDRIGKIQDKVSRAVTAHSGAVLGFDDWGTKKLAYPIQKKDRGRMWVVGYCAEPTVVSELERELRYDDVVVRFTTRVLGEAPDVETTKKRFADRAVKQKKAQAEAEERERVREEEYRARRAERGGWRGGDRDRGDRDRGGGRDRDRRDDRADRPAEAKSEAAPAEPAAPAAEPAAAAAEPKAEPAAAAAEPKPAAEPKAEPKADAKTEEGGE